MMEDTLLSFADVEERLVEAMRLCWQDEGGVWPSVRRAGHLGPDRRAWRLFLDRNEAA